jgi:hypothetical protein
MLLNIAKSLIQWIKKILNKLPFLNSLLFFSFKCHKIAFKKFLALWIISSLPLILSIVLSPVPEAIGPNVFEALWVKLKGFTFPVREQFVYAASFMAPTIYLIFEKRNEIEDNYKSSKLLDYFKIYTGYGWVFIFCIIILFTSSIAYSFLEAKDSNFFNTYLYKILEQSSLWIYLYSLYAWYMSILESIGITGNFLGTSKAEEQEIKSSFAQRLKDRHANE